MSDVMNPPTHEDRRHPCEPPIKELRFPPEATGGWDDPAPRFYAVAPGEPRPRGSAVYPNGADGATWECPVCEAVWIVRRHQWAQRHGSGHRTDTVQWERGGWLVRRRHHRRLARAGAGR